MSKKTKNKVLIVLFYFVSLFLFQMFFGVVNFNKNAQDCIADGDSVFALFTPFVKAGIYHFVTMVILAIYARLTKKIDVEYKSILYLLPVITFIFSLPVGMLAAVTGNILGMF